jgi:hypothetical protein
LGLVPSNLRQDGNESKKKTFEILRLAAHPELHPGFQAHGASHREAELRTVVAEGKQVAIKSSRLTKHPHEISFS